MAKRKNVAAVVSAMGALLDVITDLVVMIKELGADVGECLYRLARPDGKETLKAIAELLVRDYQKAKGSLTDLIAQGKYDWVNSDITADNFPVDGLVNPDEETRLFHFNQEMSSDDVVAEMDKEGWKPATIWHLLILGIKNPELQKQFPTIALGSVWRGFVPVLPWDGIHRRRNLGLRRLDVRWFGVCRFLAVRK